MSTRSKIAHFSVARLSRATIVRRIARAASREERPAGARPRSSAGLPLTRGSLLFWRLLAVRLPHPPRRRTAALTKTAGAGSFRLRQDLPLTRTVEKTVSLPTPGAARTSARRSVSDRSLRQGRQGDTIEAIAPDAATLRSRHVARRMDCGSSWTLFRITAVAVVDVGRAQVAAECAGGLSR